jgi:hypothetical protein
LHDAWLSDLSDFTTDDVAAACTGPVAPAMPMPARSAADPAIAVIRLPDFKVVISSSRGHDAMGGL